MGLGPGSHPALVQLSATPPPAGNTRDRRLGVIALELGQNCMVTLDMGVFLPVQGAVTRQM